MLFYRFSVLIAFVLALSSPPSFSQSRELAIVSPWEISSLDPLRAGYIFARMQITETLVDADNGGRPMPGLAEKWETSADGLVWTFTIRPGARFHDGTSVTPADVLAGLERARKAPGLLANVPITAIEPVERGIRIKLDRPFVALPAFLAHHSALILAPSSFNADGSVRTIIGSGPYKLTSLEAPQRLSVEAFTDWTGKKPQITRATYLAVGRGETRALMAESGQADVVFTLDPASMARLRANRGVAVEAVSIPRVITTKINAGHEFLKDARARQALSLALDRAGMARAILRDSESTPTQLFPAALAEWHNPSVSPLKTDVAEARKLLAQLGWKPGANGILERDGKAFALTLRTFPDRPELPLIATAIQAQLREVGIEVKVAVGNSSEIPAGHQDGTLELALLARNFSLVPDPIGTMIQDFGEKGGDWGAMNWRHAEMPILLAELSRTTDSDRRAELRGKLAAILQAELPVIPIAWYRHTAATSKKLVGFSIDPLERSYRLTDLKWAE